MRRDTRPTKVSGSLSNTHAGPRPTPYKRASLALIWMLLCSACRVENPLFANSQFALLISEFAFGLLICSHRKRMDRSAGEVSEDCRRRHQPRNAANAKLHRA